MEDTRKTPWGWVCIIGIGSFFSYSARSVFSPLLVLIEQELNVPHHVSTQVFAYQSFGAMISMFFSAYLLSKITPKKLYTATLLFGGLFLTLAALVTTFSHMNLLILAAGIFFGIYNPTYLTILAQIVNSKHWARSTAYVELGVIFSFILTPLWITSIHTEVGWRGCVIIVGCVNMLAGIWYGIYGKCGIYTVEAPTKSAMYALLSERALYIFIAFYSAILIAEFSVYSISSVYLVSERHLSLSHANTLLSISRILSIVMVPLGGYLADKYPPKFVLSILIVLQMTSTAMFASDIYILQAVGICLQAGASSFGFPAIFALLPYSFKPSQQAVIIALASPIASLLGTGLVPLLLGYIGEYASFSVGLYGIVMLFCALIPVTCYISKVTP